MKNHQGWKLRLRYGIETTPYKHYTVLADGVVHELQDGFECRKGPAWMAMKAWATDANESADRIQATGKKIGFELTGKIEIYKTDPEEPPEDHPYGYAIHFTAYDK